MNDALSGFLTPNLVLTAGFIAVLVLRKAVRAQFGAKVGYALWLIPPLAVLASLLPPRVVKIVESLPPADAMTGGPEYVLPPVDLPDVAQAAAPLEAVVATAPPIDPALIALFVWLAGVVAMLAWLGRRQAQFMTDVHAGKAGPAIVGFIHPYIVTPQDFDTRFNEGEQRVILAHENIHLNRHDAQINALVALVRCVCWYNPLVHVAAHCLRIDQELACDATVVERHPKARRLYADALLKAQLAARPLPLGCYWPAGTEHPLMERIEMLKRAKPGKLRRLAGVGLLVALTGGAGLAAWAAMPPETRVVFAYEQTPAPAAAQKIDYSWENIVRIQGKVVAVNLDGSPPTVHVEGVQLDTTGGAQPRQVWTIDLTPKGRAPTQDRDLAAARIGTMVDVYAYPIDKTCAANCLLWGRSFKAFVPAQALPAPDAVKIRGILDRFGDVSAMIWVEGAVTSVVRSGQDNIITVRSTNVRRGTTATADWTSETGDWRFIQFNGATLDRNPFNDPAAVGMQIRASGLPGTGAACASPCTLAFAGSNIMMSKGKPYSAPKRLTPPADRRGDAPSPIAQPGFNAEDYVVVRGSIVRIEGGNPVKTFWVKAREINRNYEKTQANADIWRVDRQAPGGASLSGDLKVGADVRVDGYVSVSCQPECRIQPMLIDLASQQAGGSPAAPKSTPGVQPIRHEPQEVIKPKVVVVTGKVQRVDLQNPNSYVWVEAQTINRTHRSGGDEATSQVYRVIAGSKDEAPQWARTDAVGATVRLFGYEGSTSCGAVCDMAGLDVFLVLPSGETTFCTRHKPTPWNAPGAWETCSPLNEGRPSPVMPVPASLPKLPPPDFLPFAKYFDAEKPVMLKGKVTGKELFEGKAVMLWVESTASHREGASGSAKGSAADFTPDKRRWRVVLGPSSLTPPEMIDTLIGQDVTIRGYDAKEASCNAGCLVNARDITLASGDRILFGGSGSAPVVRPASKTPAGALTKPIEFSAPDKKPLPDLIRFDKFFDAKTPLVLKGKVKSVETFWGHAALTVEESETIGRGYTRLPAPGATKRVVWRVVLERAENAPAWARDAGLVGKWITVRGYNGKAPCELECMMSGREVQVEGGATLPGWMAPKPSSTAKQQAMLQPIRYEPQAAGTAMTYAGPERPNRIYLTGKRGRFIWSNMPPPDVAPEIAGRIDAGRDLTLRGTVTAVETSGDNLMLTISARSLSAFYGAEEPDARSWRVAVGKIGPSRDTLRDASRHLVGQDVNVRGMGLKDDACEPSCQMIARDVTVTSEPPIRHPSVPL